MRRARRGTRPSRRGISPWERRHDACRLPGAAGRPRPAAAARNPGLDRGGAASRPGGRPAHPGRRPNPRRAGRCGACGRWGAPSAGDAGHRARHPQRRRRGMHGLPARGRQPVQGLCPAGRHRRGRRHHLHQHRGGAGIIQQHRAGLFPACDGLRWLCRRRLGHRPRDGAAQHPFRPAVPPCRWRVGRPRAGQRGPGPAGTAACVGGAAAGRPGLDAGPLGHGGCGRAGQPPGDGGLGRPARARNAARSPARAGAGSGRGSRAG